MATRWTKEEEQYYRVELERLYIQENMTVNEIGGVLDIALQSVFARLHRLGISTQPQRKLRYLNQRTDIKIPVGYSDDLAEFFGIMLCDGHLCRFQVTVALGTKEKTYAEYVAKLMGKIFGPIGTIALRGKYSVVCVGSVEATRWLQSEGLVFNKVKSQVGAPEWIFEKESFMRRFVRGFFDTDGSVYELKHGIQISLTNHSVPLLLSLQQMLVALHYNVSSISCWHLYITKIKDVRRFFEEVVPQNQKHNERFKFFLDRYEKVRTGSPVGCGDRL